MSKYKGFTLIELLIVITILGILATVLLSILNPILIMKRTRDATVVSAIIKIAFVVQAHTSATGRIPSNQGCTCDDWNSCELLTSLSEGTVKCHKTQVVAQGTKLWMEVQGIKLGRTLLGTEIDLDDSDAIRYHDWGGGCIAAVSEANPPWVFVWHPNHGLLTCHPGTEIHPGLFTCQNLNSSHFRQHNCSLY